MTILRRDPGEKLGMGLSIENFDTRLDGAENSSNEKNFPSRTDCELFVIVKVLDKVGPARRCVPLLCVGDRILSLNGVELSILDRKTCLNMFKAAPAVNILVIERAQSVET